MDASKKHDFDWGTGKCRRCAMTFDQVVRTLQTCTRVMPLSRIQQRLEKGLRGR